jgi:hypothetical protein
MVARINTAKNISKVLNYNEQKCRQNRANILYASNFFKDTLDLIFYDKLNHFKKFISLNEKVTTNTLHVSLNFDPSEKLANDTLIAIANDYMKMIGFGDQPYLVYRHNDAGHPHIHIVSTNIRNDGSRISMHNLGKNQSESARKEIEFKYGLVRAQGKKLTEAAKLHPSARQIVAAIDSFFQTTKQPGLGDFIQKLKEQDIEVDLRKNRYGLIYGIKYTDHRSNMVFNGSDLGKSYSAKMILEKCGASAMKLSAYTRKKSSSPKSSKKTKENTPEGTISTTATHLLETLTDPAIQNEPIPLQLKMSKKKRKRKRLHQ